MPELKVRYFASAREAAGVAAETVEVSDGATAGEVIAELTRRHPGRFAAVVNSASLLLDGLAVRSPDTSVGSASELDVLPPFAGG